MNGLYAAAAELHAFLGEKGWRFCIIGGLAVLRWGRARTTRDVDVSLLADFGKEAELADALLRRFRERVPGARPFAVENRVVLCQATNGVPLNIALAVFPFEKRVIDRATPYDYAPGTRLVTASAEDLVVLKAIAGRDQDWADVRGILERQGPLLDWALVVREMTGLKELMENQDPLARLEDLRRQPGGPGR